MKKRIHLLVILLGILVAGLCFKAKAQKKENNYSVEIITEDDGHRRIFKKSYSDPQAFMDDEDYKEFFGEDSPKMMVFKADSFGSNTRSWQKIFDWQNADSAISFHFNKALFLQDKDSLLKAMDKHLKTLDEHLSRLDFNIRWEDDNNIHFRSFSGENDKISVQDFDQHEDEAIIKKNKLSLVNDIHIYEMRIRTYTQAEKISMKFRTDIEAPLAVNIYDDNGNIYFNESMVSFRGYYDREIDLAGIQPGIYILDIVRGKNKFSKKIEIKG